jgi:hypothetical protein
MTSETERRGGTYGSRPNFLARISATVSAVSGAMQDTKLLAVYQEVVFYPNGTGSLSF